MPIIHLNDLSRLFLMTPKSTVTLRKTVPQEKDLHSIEEAILDLVREIYVNIGWPGVVLLMALDSLPNPLPGEIIMPSAGWFLIKDQGHGIAYVFLAAFYGALGNLIGSWIAYGIGAAGGKPLIGKFGKYLFISVKDLDKAEGWFQKHGDRAIFLSRMIPVVRSLISLPAGAARMNIWKFSLYTFLGSYPFAFGLALGGFMLGANWDRLSGPLGKFATVLAIVVAVLIVFFLWRRFRRGRAPQDETFNRAS